MSSWGEQSLGEVVRVVRDRARAGFLKLRGADVGDRTRIGAGCVFHRPWCLTTGERVQIEHHVYVKAVCDTATIRMGREVFVGFNSEFDVSDRLTIGDHVLIAPGCFITDHGHLHAPGRTIASQGCSSDPVCIEDDVWLGAKVIVLPGVTIGRGAVVAAGAVVTSDVEPMTIVAGVPARKLRAR